MANTKAGDLRTPFKKAVANFIEGNRTGAYRSVDFIKTVLRLSEHGKVAHFALGSADLEYSYRQRYPSSERQQFLPIRGAWYDRSCQTSNKADHDSS